jgi:hypothetical protein
MVYTLVSVALEEVRGKGIPKSLIDSMHDRTCEFTKASISSARAPTGAMKVAAAPPNIESRALRRFDGSSTDAPGADRNFCTRVDAPAEFSDCRLSTGRFVTRDEARHGINAKCLILSLVACCGEIRVD